MHDNFKLNITGHVKIIDENNNVLLDKDNAIHLINMPAILSRALVHRPNSSMFSLALGNGGTSTNAASQTTLNPPNIGVQPDFRTWDSRLYNEIYREVVDFTSPNFAVDLGDSDFNTGIRRGYDSVPQDDPTPTLWVNGGLVSVENGLSSQITATCVINAAEPTFVTPENALVFNEIGLYSEGLQAISTPGYQDVFVGNANSTTITNLLYNQQYSFKIAVNGGAVVPIVFTCPTNNPTFGVLCQALNTGDVSWNPSWAGVSPLPNATTVSITDNTTNYPTITGSVTDGNLRFSSSTVGSTSSIALSNGTVGTNLFAANTLAMSQSTQLLNAVPGQDAGVQNSPTNTTLERERLLCHLTFFPVTKQYNSPITITYTISFTISSS